MLAIGLDDEDVTLAALQKAGSISATIMPPLNLIRSPFPDAFERPLIAREGGA